MTDKNGNRENFCEIIERFTLFIQAHIQKFNPQKNGIDPYDIAQEVKIKIWKILNDEKKIQNYSSYIKKVVNSTVIDQIRRARRQEGIINLEKQKKISEQKSFYSMNISGAKDLKYIVGEAVDSLMESRRKAVRLFLLNMTIEEIALILNWSKAKTRNLIYRGLADIKKKLKKEAIEYED
jgi:RNA polymerase sigma-70 factor (ECF subfamily)